MKLQQIIINFLKYLKPYWFKELITLILMILSSIGTLISPYVLKIIINVLRIFKNKENFRLLRIKQMSRKKTRISRLESIKKIIENGLGREDVLLSSFREVTGLSLRSIEEYLEIIKYLSENPVKVIVEKKGRYTFVSMKQPE